MAVEIISVGSRRTDRIAKLGEYAEAGIPDYWILDLDSLALDTFRLTDAAFQPVLRAATGIVALDVPVALTIDLDALFP